MDNLFLNLKKIEGGDRPSKDFSFDQINSLLSNEEIYFRNKNANILSFLLHVLIKTNIIR